MADHLANLLDFLNDGSATSTPAAPGASNVTPPDATQTAARPATAATVPADPIDSVGNMFTEMPQKIDAQAADVAQGASHLGDVFSNVSSVLKDVSGEKLAVATAAVAAKKQLTDSQMGTNREILAETIPLFAQRQAIADRKAELDTMNPIKKAIFSIFDRNYDADWLSKHEGNIEDQIQSRGEEFTQTNSLVNQLINATNSNAEGATSLLDLKGENANQDLQLASASLQYKRASLSDSIAAVAGKTEVTRAQMLLQDQQLSTMDGANLSAAIAAAQKNGGTVMVGGAQLSLAALKQREQDLTRQHLALVAAQQSVTSGGLQIQSQKMGLQTQAEKMLIDHMSFSDTQAAINNGGIYKGRQLDLADLGARQMRLNAGMDAVVEANSGSNNVRLTGQLAGTLGDQTAAISKRAVGIFGRNIPPELMIYMNNVGRDIDLTQKTIKDSTGPAAAKQISALAPQLQARLIEGDKLIDKLAQRMSRNPDAQIAIGSWIKGNPMTAEQATKSVIAFANGGGLPPGVKLQGPVAAAMAAGQAAYQRVTQSDEYKHATAEQKQRLEQQAVGGAVGKSWTGAVTASVTEAMPDLAKRMGDPFGARINGDQFRAARHAGDAQGLQHVTDEFNSQNGTKFSTQQMEALFKGDQGTTAALNQSRSKAGQPAVTSNDLATLRQQLVAYQTSAWMQNMDQLAGAGTSKMFANFMRRDDVQSHIGQFADRTAASGFGESLADAMSPGGVRNNFANASKLIQSQVTANDSAKITSTRQLVNQYNGDPAARAGVILGNIDGLNQHDRTIAEGIIKQAARVSSGGSQFDIVQNSGIAPRTYLPDEANAAIEQAIKGTKYQDPGLRRIMGIVARDYDAAAVRTDRIMGRLATGEHK